MKFLLCAGLLFIGAGVVLADPPGAAEPGGLTVVSPAPFVANESPDDLLFSSPDPLLSEQEERALAIAEQWQSGNATVSGGNGVIRFPFGAAQPSIVCAVLQVCDMRLEPGETINSINLGDTARWTVEPAITGSDEDEVQHVIVKPLDVGLETSLIVTTDRRTYHVRLRSHRTRYMPQVAFTYSDGLAKKEAAKAKAKKRETERAAKARMGMGERQQGRGLDEVAPSPATTPAPTEYLGNLRFNYAVVGAARWKPVRAYDDGKKTYIQMPSSISESGAQPTLLVVRPDGGAAGKEDNRTLNYRVQGDRYVVDGLFERAFLLAGVGSEQERITIERIQ